MAISKRDKAWFKGRCVTPRQVEILTLIRNARRSLGYSPTLQEIADELGISKITVFEHVEVLIAKGMLTRRSNRARSLELTALVQQLPDDQKVSIRKLEAEWNKLDKQTKTLGNAIRIAIKRHRQANRGRLASSVKSTSG